MAKRFTDTAKWDDGWFCSLPPASKFLWTYLCDKCDHAGIWKVNIALAKFHLGSEIDFSPKQFGDRVVVVNNEKWFLVKFIQFQYGDLNPSNKAHASVLAILKKEGLSKPLVRGLVGAKDKDTDKDKDKETDVKGGSGENLCGYKDKGSGWCSQPAAPGALYCSHHIMKIGDKAQAKKVERPARITSAREAVAGALRR